MQRGTIAENQRHSSSYAVNLLCKPQVRLPKARRYLRLLRQSRWHPMKFLQPWRQGLSLCQARWKIPHFSQTRREASAAGRVFQIAGPDVKRCAIAVPLAIFTKMAARSIITSVDSRTPHHIQGKDRTLAVLLALRFGDYRH